MSTVYLPLALCCILFVAGSTIGGIFAAAPVRFGAASLKPVAGLQQPAWYADSAVTMYGGAYTAAVRNLRFEPAGAASSHRKLVADLLYSNLSPFVVHVEHNSRMQALVFDDEGTRLGSFTAGPQDLPPGGAIQVPLSLGTDYPVARNAGARLSVLFADAGGNSAGWLSARLDE